MVLVVPGQHAPAIVRFWRFVERLDDGCWRWIGGGDRKGYGRFRDECQRAVSAHRWAYGYFQTPIPADRQTDHTCNRPWCVNPAHIEIVDNDENQRRKAERHQACLHGHPWDEVNTRYKTMKNGRLQRVCRTCHRESVRKRSQRQKERVNGDN